MLREHAGCVRECACTRWACIAKSAVYRETRCDPRAEYHARIHRVGRITQRGLNVKLENGGFLSVCKTAIGQSTWPYLLYMKKPLTACNIMRMTQRKINDIFGKLENPLSSLAFSILISSIMI